MDSIPRTSGIYKIVCVPTGKVYVGSAVDLQVRKRSHWATLRRSSHKNRHLQNAWNKYGESAFEFQVIEQVLIPFLIEREQYWLDKLQAYDRQHGYNARIIADSNRGLVRSEELRRRWSELKLGKKRGPMSQAHREALSLAKRGKKRKPYSPEARLRRGAAMRGRKLSSETRAKIGAANRGKKPSEATRAAQFEATSKLWLVVDPDGNEQVIKGLEGFCRKHGLIAVSMANVAKGKQRRHKGWKCYRVEDSNVLSDPSSSDN